MSIEIGGLFGLLVFIFDIWALFKTLSSDLSAGDKLLWVVVILLLPFVGLLLWWFAGPGQELK